MTPGLRPKSPPAQAHPRIIRYGELVPCRDAFIDTRSPGSDAKENFTLIGPGVSENPAQHVHIAEPHGFNIGGARQPAGCLNSQHSHNTAEVFYVHTGRWAFTTGEHGTDGRVELGPGDIISIPTGVFRGFENIGDEVGYLFAVLGGDDPGRVLWAPEVFAMAEDYGLVLLDNGNLVDTGAGEALPDGARPMPVTSRAQVAALKTLGDADLRACCVTAGQDVPEEAGKGWVRRALIGPSAPLDWTHGFTVDVTNAEPDAFVLQETSDRPDVLFVQQGSAEIRVDGELWPLGRGDTATVPTGARRTITSGPDGLTLLRVQGI